MDSTKPSPYLAQLRAREKNLTHKIEKRIPSFSDRKDEALDRAANGFAAIRDAHGGQAFGLFSCSKSTNEMNYAAQKFARVVMGSNNLDSCNRT